MKYDFRQSVPAPKTRKGFTLLEMTGTIFIIALITTSVVMVMNNCIEATTNYKLKAIAYRVARDNMEKMLNTKKLAESAEFGICELNPDIQWETVVEVFNEPINSNMWLQAKSAASYTDTDGQIQTVEFTQWVTGLTGAQQKLIENQRKREQEFLDEYDQNPFGDDADGLLEYAEFLEDAGNMERAITTAQELITQYPDSDEAKIAISKIRKWTEQIMDPDLLENLPAWKAFKNRGSQNDSDSGKDSNTGNNNNTANDTDNGNSQQDNTNNENGSESGNKYDFECPPSAPPALCDFFQKLIDGEI